MCLVSVIIPYYNRGDTLPRALDSVCNQSNKDFEIVLVNDGSTDQSTKIVEKYIRQHPDIRFKHVTQANRGPSGARNNGVRQAVGKYIAFLDSDDSWEPTKLEIQIEYMEKNPQIAITGTNYYIVKDHKWLRYPLEPTIIEPGFYHILFKVFFWTSTIVIRREVFLRDNIWYLEGKNRGEDHLLYLQILREHRGIRFSQPLANMYKLEYGEEGLTEDLSKLLECDLDNLKIIYSDKEHPKRVSVTLFFVLNIYLYLKHFKRVLRSGWYKRGR